MLCCLCTHICLVYICVCVFEYVCILKCSLRDCIRNLIAMLCLLLYTMRCGHQMTTDIYSIRYQRCCTIMSDAPIVRRFVARTHTPHTLFVLMFFNFVFIFFLFCLFFFFFVLFLCSFLYYFWRSLSRMSVRFQAASRCIGIV